MHAYTHIFGVHQHSDCMTSVCPAQLDFLHAYFILLHRQDLIENVGKFQSAH